MSYVQNGIIEYGDVNTFATGSPTSIVPNPALVNINSLWGTGYGNVGYGQTGSLPTVSQNSLVTAADWTPLVTSINKVLTHQYGNNSGVLPIPAKNSTITYVKQYDTLLRSLWSTRLNSYSPGGSTIAKSKTVSDGWTNTISATFNITFSSGDAARYFFNCGGSIKINFAATNYWSTSPQAVMMNTLCNQTGNLYICAPGETPGVNDTIKLGTNSFTGFTQVTVGSIATRTTYLPSGGYYGLTSVSKLLYKIIGTIVPNSPNSYLAVGAKTNGPQGPNGDNGNVITVYTTWFVSPTATTSIAGVFNTTCTVTSPETTYLENSWGTPTITVA